MIPYIASLLIFLLVQIFSVESQKLTSDLPSSEPIGFIHGSSKSNDGDDSVGTKWALLIAGSNEYFNYRHQANICHAYQILKKGGLKDENIVVFMYDDIAFHPDNPRPGVMINSPHGDDVYTGVPKDYTGEDVNVNNFFAALLGNKTALTGGSGKVVDSGPNDHIFVYYADHGGPGVLGMPTSENIYAGDLNNVLKKKHELGSYKSLVFYVEACESGSIFEGLLPEGLNIYVTTASNSEENSYGTYCPGEYPNPPTEYDTCLGDLYSIAWLEDSDAHNLQKETLEQQYELVRRRTKYEDFDFGSHVMQYGDIHLSKNNLFLYMGTNPANDNFTFTLENSSPLFVGSGAVNQRDADLIHFWHKFRRAPEASSRKLKAQKQYLGVIEHRMHIDHSMKRIGQLLFGSEKGEKILKAVRSKEQPLVDDWECLKNMVRTYETHCGFLNKYGLKHMRAMANICNAGLQKEKMAEASAQACLRVLPSP